MFKGTTPTLTLTFDESVDLTEAKSVVVTFATDFHKVIAEKADGELTITANTIEVSFTQEETLSMRPGRMLVQVNILYDDSSRVCSNIGEVSWVENLKDEVMV